MKDSDDDSNLVLAARTYLEDRYIKNDVIQCIHVSTFLGPRLKILACLEFDERKNIHEHFKTQALILENEDVSVKKTKR